MIKVQKKIISSAFVGLAVLGIAVQCSEVSAQALDKEVVQEERVSRRQKNASPIKKQIEEYISKNPAKYRLVDYFEGSVMGREVSSLEDFMRLEVSLQVGNYQIHVGGLEIHLQVLN